MAESIQKKLSRVRPPRVQITYDVETGGAIEKKELPFVIGVVSDLTGVDADNEADKKKPLRDRKFVQIDRDNFNSVLADAAPRVKYTVPNKLGDEKDAGDLSVDLTFTTFDDFEPEKVVDKIEVLSDLLKARNLLRDLSTKLDGNDVLNESLSSVIKDEKQQKELLDLIKKARPTAKPAEEETKNPS